MLLKYFLCSNEMCFLSCHLKVMVAEALIKSGIEGDTFWPTNVREHFPQDELTLVKNNLLEADSLVEWE